MKLAIDPKKTRAIVLTWPDHSLTWEMAAWLYNIFPPANILGLCVQGIIEARNRSVAELVLKAPSEITDFVFMDRDMRPGRAAIEVLRAEGDVVACTYPTPRMETWADPTTLHMGLVRVKRRVFEAIEPPWFMFGYSPDGTRRAKCECGYFRDKAIEAGFKVVRAGWCGHGPKR